jgi:hypothetical protein
VRELVGELAPAFRIREQKEETFLSWLLDKRPDRFLFVD